MFISVTSSSYDIQNLPSPKLPNLQTHESYLFTNSRIQLLFISDAKLCYFRARIVYDYVPNSVPPIDDNFKI